MDDSSSFLLVLHLGVGGSGDIAIPKRTPKSEKTPKPKMTLKSKRTPKSERTPKPISLKPQE